LNLDAYRARWNFAPDASRIAALTELGLLQQDGARLIATPQGRLVLNSVIAELLNA
jgi:coproporphyrinogen III oxidase-like Fe-S oxidoreductase